MYFWAENKYIHIKSFIPGFRSQKKDKWASASI